MIHLRSIVHRRLQSGKMNTKPGACRWSFHPSDLIPLQMVNFANFVFFWYMLRIVAPFWLALFINVCLWCHSSCVQPFDHIAVACFSDLMPALWSVLCGPRTVCVMVCVLLSWCQLKMLILEYCKNILSWSMQQKGCRIAMFFSGRGGWVLKCSNRKFT